VPQERIFAPRTLHFSDKQLFWECEVPEACFVLFREPNWGESDQSSHYGILEGHFKFNNPEIADRFCSKLGRSVRAALGD
jgi:hypothetical protein